MGIVYYQKEDYVNAEKFYNEALYNFQLFDSNYDDEKYYGINTSLLNLSLIKRDQGDLKSSEELLDQLFERVNSNSISRTDILQVYISYMELFLISGNVITSLGGQGGGKLDPLECVQKNMVDRRLNVKQNLNLY